ncbi:GAF domain-containing protein [Paludifilum halophilum]|uniref:GAF domain-containing protein n=1 Tax=Paludifilum halophilum TaxID=1642702 RepID=UPI0011402E3D|nr:GAF domain-containing protein [Paludifilum halophilum]
MSVIITLVTFFFPDLGKRIAQSVVTGNGWPLVVLMTFLLIGTVFSRYKVKKKVDRLLGKWTNEQKKVQETTQSTREKMDLQEHLWKQIFLLSCELSMNCRGFYNNLSPRDRSTSYRCIYEIVQEALRNEKSGDPRVQIFVEDENNTGLLKPHLSAFVGHRSRARDNRIEKSISTAAGYTYLTGETYFDSDTTREDSLCQRKPKANRPFYSMICVAIEVEEQILGVLSVTGDQKESYREVHRDFLEITANMLVPLLISDLQRKKSNGSESVPQNEKKRDEDTEVYVLERGFRAE